MHRRIKKVFTFFKEHTCVSYAKIATIGGFCDLDHIVVKATSPDDTPLPDRYVLEILQIFAICPSSFGSFALSFSQRFSKTKCWRVVLKCLLLLHRLLQTLPYTSSFREELLLARSNGLMSLYPCSFKDRLSSTSQDYTNFIWSYARLLDEFLDCCATQAKEIDEYHQSKENFIDKMDEVRLMLEYLPKLQSLIDRVMDCRPTGQAMRNVIVQSVMKHVIRDSFTCYTTFRKDIVEVLDCLIQLPYINCVAAFEIYKKAANQANELCEFYDWCKSLRLCGMYEYPFIDKIPQIHIRALENFLNGMWQATNDPSSSTSVSPLTSTEDGSDYKQKQAMLLEPSKNIVGSVSDTPKINTSESIFKEFEQHKKQDRQSRFDSQYSVTKGDSEMQPLIQFEDNNQDWETLLDASVSFQSTSSRTNFYLQKNAYQYEDELKDLQKNGWEIQVYNQSNIAPLHNGTYPTNPIYHWGI